MTAGKVIFTLGGGYSRHAASRVRATLNLLVNDLPVPDTIPEVWSKKWANHLGGKATLGLHDPDPAYPPMPHHDEIMQRNRVVAGRLLDALVPFWY